MKPYSWTALALIPTLFGCGSDDGVSPTTGASVEFVSGNLATDTVDAILPHALVVVVRDSAGRRAPLGTVVRFTPLLSPAPEGAPLGMGYVYDALVRGPTELAFSPFTAATTDASGRTAVAIQLGTRAGAVRVLVSVPALDLIDTAEFTARPGAPYQMSVVPGDTAVYAGAQYQLRGGVADRHWNVRTDSITWQGTGVTVSATGAVTAGTIGRHSVTLTAGSRQITARVSVIPHGRIVARRGAHIVAFDLDGSHVDTLAAGDETSGVGTPRWIPHTNAVVYPAYTNGIMRLYTVDASGATKLFPDPLPSAVQNMGEPAPTASGNWVYFGAFDPACGDNPYQVFCLYRAKPDGSSAQRLGVHMQQPGTDFSPSPSPDGSKVAFVTDGSGYSVIRVLHVAADTLEHQSTLGVNPSWSPDGSRIAYLSSFDGTLLVMNADGTGSRAVVPSGRRYSRQPIGWSPDNQWLILHSDEVLEVVNVQTGVVLPLAYSESLYGPDWR